LGHNKHHESGNQHIAAMVRKSGAMIVARGVHHQQTGAYQKKNRKRQRAIKADQPRGDAIAK
jgi:hypothetical protein